MNNQIKAGLYAGFLLIPISIMGFSGENVRPSNESSEIASVVTLVRKDVEKKMEVLVERALKKSLNILSTFEK